jgi:hypothetical protein
MWRRIKKPEAGTVVAAVIGIGVLDGYGGW